MCVCIIWNTRFSSFVNEWKYVYSIWVYIGIGNGFVEQKLFCYVDGGERWFGRQKWLCVGRHFDRRTTLEGLRRGNQVIWGTVFTPTSDNNVTFAYGCPSFIYPYGNAPSLTWLLVSYVFVFACVSALLSSCLSIYYGTVVTIEVDLFGLGKGLYLETRLYEKGCLDVWKSEFVLRRTYEVIYVNFID